MHYILFDLEFNQDFAAPQNFGRSKSQYPFEIIQIGAVKLDASLQTVDTFKRYVKPTLYEKVSPFITELTGITTEQLLRESLFPEVYQAYTTFIGAEDAVFCTWGMSDIKELFKNAGYHHLDNKSLPRLFINIQPYVSKHLHLPSKKLLRLQHAAELLCVPLTYPFHDALYDAHYTAEVFKKVYNSSIQPITYNPSYVAIRPRQVNPRKEADYERLVQQFEKMYDRTMTEEEQDIIMLAYKMGKTNQFLK